MRTTIRIEDEVLRAAKSAAAQAGHTLSAFIEDTLRTRLAEQRTESQPAGELPVFEGDGLLPGIDLDDSSGLVDRMEATEDR